MNPLVLALVSRGSPGRPEWLARWSDALGGILFIHKSVQADETVEQAALEALVQQTGLPAGQFAIRSAPPFRMEIASRPATPGNPTTLPLALVPLEIHPEGLRQLESDPGNVWLTRADLLTGATSDGRQILPLLPRLMEKAGLLDTELFVSRTVFVSSTFRDFHAERDYLRDVVLPEIQEECRGRGFRLRVHLVDLRQGVDTLSVVQEGEQADPEEIDRRKQLLVLKYCLDEIERSRPFFLALLGDRYGWIAPVARSSEVAAQMGLPLSVDELAVTSVTALEIEYGVLSHTAPARCHFFLREPLPMPAWVAAGLVSEATAAVYSDRWLADRSKSPTAGLAAERLEQLKARIRERVHQERVHSYQVQWDARKSLPGELEQFGNRVKACLLADIIAEMRDLLSRTPLTPLEDFVQGRAAAFQGRGDDLGRLLAWARSEATDPTLTGKRGVCLQAEPGLGKSALFARLVQSLSGDQGLLVLAHAAGIGPGSGSVTEMLRGFVLTLARALDRPTPLQPDCSDEQAEEAFAELLSAAAERQRVVVLLDALNQFEPTPRAQHLSWLTRNWPANARLLATTSIGPAATAFAAQDGFTVLPLRPLNTEEAAAICDSVSHQRYRRRMNPVVRRVLLERALPNGGCAAGNALWLELALDSVHGLDADDYERWNEKPTVP